ncbi:MAG: hypothetical protein ACTHNL_12200 [Devosia sp.]|jgi:hypothetical protein
MPKLLDLFRITRKEPATKRPFFSQDARLRPEERQTLILADKYPPDAADIESISEYRLSSLLQYPHY